jgi:uncharacterized delta-60 repeat protein
MTTNGMSPATVPAANAKRPHAKSSLPHPASRPRSMFAQRFRWWAGLIVLWAAPAFGQSALDGFDPNPDGAVRAIIVQADGRILLGGDFRQMGLSNCHNIARLLADGSVDPAFHADVGAVGGDHPSRVNCLAVQADGKILVGGDFEGLAGVEAYGFGRLNADGNGDDTFVSPFNGGPLGGEPMMWCTAVQPDGKILVGGDFILLGAAPRTNIVRLHADGSVDTGFRATADFWVRDVALQPDGKIVVGGWFTNLAGDLQPHLGRLHADGTLDDTFTPDINGWVTRVSVLPDGSILASGGFSQVSGLPRPGLVRLRPDGSVDETFNPVINGTPRRHLVQADGRILLGGSFGSVGGLVRPNLARVWPNGSVDATFNSEADSSVLSLAAQSDGKIIVGGLFSRLAGTNRNYLGRLYPDGSLDATLTVTSGTSSFNGVVEGLALQPDGRILVGGVFETLGGQPRTNIGRLQADGSLDPTFNPGAPNGLVNTFITQPDGKIVVAGLAVSRLAGQTRTNIGRLNPDGTLDTSFNASVDFVRFLFGNLEMHALAAQADGKILVSGCFNRVNGQARANIARLNPDGSLDTAFTAGTEDNQLYYSAVRTVAVQADGKIVVGGAFHMMNGQPARSLCRLQADGTLDTAFSNSVIGEVYALVVQADGKIVVGGGFNNLSGYPRTNLARLNPDGSVDASFDAGVSAGANAAAVWGLALQTDGKILVGGSFTNLGGQPCHHLGRLNPDGSVDLGFSPIVHHANPGAISTTVCGLALQADGKIVVGGWFSALAGEERSRVGRLTSGSAALQSLAINASGTTVTWRRSGSGPEVEQVTFELSLDGTNFTALGHATRIPGGWELSGLALPAGQNFYARARGRVTSGIYDGSSGLIESVAQFYRIPPPPLVALPVSGNGAFGFAFSNPGGHSFTVLATTNLHSPAGDWEVLGAPVPVGGGVYQFTDPHASNFPARYYHLHWP